MSDASDSKKIVSSAAATLEQVAVRAGVSTATASRVLNDAANVAESTRKRVMRAVRELRYRPNLHARTLARGQSRTIGMIVSNLENPFFVDIFCSLEAAASRHGYAVVVEHTGYMSERLAESVRSMLGRHLAGIAAIVSEMDGEKVEELASQNVPTVLFDVAAPMRGNVRTIQVRYEIGMQRTIEYLYSMGHRRMAFVGHHASLAPLEARRKTFVATMNVHASDAEFTTVESEDGPAGGRDAARRLLHTPFRPTAIVCTNDFMALGVLRELKERGLRVPGDVSVTGFDNILLSEYSSPALTTVDVPRARIGQLCFEALARVSGREKTTQTMTIDPELVLRESTGGAAL